jgi:hypothetical protein
MFIIPKLATQLDLNPYFFIITCIFLKLLNAHPSTTLTALFCPCVLAPIPYIKIQST